MEQFTNSKFGNFGNTSPIMPLLDRPQGPRGLSNIELAQINLNANIAKKAKQKENNAKTREFGKHIMRLAQSKNVPLTLPPLPTKKRPLVPRSPVSNSSVPTSPVSNSSVSNYPVSISPIPPIPNRPLPKMTKNQEKKWENYTRTHSSVMLGMTGPTRPLPPLPVEGAHRKTRRIRKNKTRKTRSNRR